MNFLLEKEDNSIVTCVFDETVSVEASVYNRINHNIGLMLPCMRDLSDTTRIHFDVLGVTPLDDIISQKEYDRRALYDLIYQIVDRLEAVVALGMDMSQIVLDRSYVFVSDYDGSLRWLCLPVTTENHDGEKIWMLFLRDLVLSISSNGAYDLIGFVIEKASGEGNDIAAFKREWTQMFSERNDSAANSRQEPEEKPRPAAVQTANVQNIRERDLTDTVELKSEPSGNVFTGREYIPEGVSDQFADEGTIGSTRGTQLLFGNTEMPQSVAYLAPVGGNQASSRIYLTGTRLTVGRLPDNDLCIGLATISGHHAEIRVTKDGFTLVDLHSTNKTFLNGKPLIPNVPVVLHHQDVISFNKMQYTFYAH